MKSLDNRSDHFTDQLLKFEKKLEGALGDSKRALRTVEEIEDSLDPPGSVITSRDLDFFLQTVMLALSARLNLGANTPARCDFKVTTALYYKRHGFAVLVKPSYYFPGHCSLLHPTFSLSRPNANRIGHTGLALLGNKIHYCNNLGNSPGSCPQYLPLSWHEPGRSSAAGLSVPLNNSFATTREAFLEAVERGDVRCVPSCETGTPEPDSCEGVVPLGVLNIECSSQEFSAHRAAALLREEPIARLVSALDGTLRRYLEERPKYKIASRLLSPFELHQHKLQPREELKTVLREVSKITGGADVTLHLRDMYPATGESEALRQRNEKRCIRLVVGVGERFRGYLIHERYGLGQGLVGTAVETGATQRLGSDDITRVLGSVADSDYRQLMPGTAMNLAVPLKFHDFVYGALNVEWSRERVPAGPAEQLLLLDKFADALERVGAYLTFMNDYYDDLLLARRERSGPAAGEVARATVRRGQLSYYVSTTIGKIMHEIKLSAQEQSEGGRYAFLYNLVSAVAFFSEAFPELQVMSSLRLLRRREGDLKLILEYGLSRPKNSDSTDSGDPRSEISVQEGQSVLGTCAIIGIPLFGKVEKEERLLLDPLCVEFLEKNGKFYEGNRIKYKSTGKENSKFELGVPLIVGSAVEGTLDIEYFDPAGEQRGDAGSGASPRDGDEMSGDILFAFLQWARAIAFCLAYEEDKDLRGPLAELDQTQAAAFGRIQRLCAHQIADVPMPAKQENAVAVEYFRELAPTADVTVRGAREEARSKLVATPLTYRDQLIGHLSISGPPRSSTMGTTSFTRPGGPGNVVSRLMNAYYTTSLLPGGPRSGSTDFKPAIGRIGEEIHKWTDRRLNDPDASAVEVVESLFDFLHHQLHLRIGAERGGGKYSWFLNIAELRDGASFLHCRGGKWAYALTASMKKRIDELMLGAESHQGPDAALESYSAAARERLRPLLMQEPPDRLAIHSALLAVLASGVYPHPQTAPGGNLPFTSIVARTLQVRSAVDITRDPFRSETHRKEHWGGKTPYSIIGIPVELGGRAIGVMNILRQGEDRFRPDFFRGNEISSAEKLQQALRASLQALLECRTVNASGAPTTWPYRTRLIEQLQSQSTNQMIIVPTYLYNEPNILEKICREAVGGQVKFFNWPKSDFDNIEDFAKRAPRDMAFTFTEKCASRGEYEEAFRLFEQRIKDEASVVVFCGETAKEEECLRALTSGLENRVEWLRSEPETPAERQAYVKSLISELAQSTGRAATPSTVVLRHNRVDGVAHCSLGSLVEAAGPSIAVMQQRGPASLRRLLAPEAAGWRPFPDWLVCGDPSPNGGVNEQ